MLNRFKIGTRIGAGFALGLTLLAVLGAIAYRTTTSLIRNAEREKLSYQILAHLNELETELINDETGQRGYMITGQRRYLEPYDSALAEVYARYETLRQLTANDSALQSRLTNLQPLVDARLDRLQEGIQIRDTEGFTAA